jgi:hypothetical protein
MQIIALTDIHEEDGYHWDKEDLIGAVFEIDTDEVRKPRELEGFKSLTWAMPMGAKHPLVYEGDKPDYICFFAVKYEVLFGVQT